MNNRLIQSKVHLLAPAFAFTIFFFTNTALADRPSTEQLTAPSRPKIQLALLLDTSNSMDGLIDQARNQLWQIVNEFSQSNRNGVAPSLEVAIYEYGNDGLSQQRGYVRKVSALTGELDQISESLFSLTTNGGNEYCGYVINKAVTDLQWSTSDNDIKAIFIAGNEPFTQGPVPFSQAIEKARAKGITVNTIHAGSYEEGVNGGWKQGALLAGGDYMSIDQNHQIAHVAAPQDQRIAELNKQLNATYVPYGTQGKLKAERQIAQDAQNEAISTALLAKRVQSKASSFYNNAKWDLVDALSSGEVALTEIDPVDLPEPMRKMSEPEKRQYVKQNAEQRKNIQAEINRLSVERDQYVAEEKRKAAAPDINTIDKAFTASIQRIGSEKGFSFNTK